MFITQHCSVTVDAKLSPTVNALLCGDQDFLRLLSYWIVAGVTFHFELQGNALIIVLQWQKLLEIFFFSFSLSFNSHYRKILPVGSRGSPDSHVSNSPAQANIRSLFICPLQLRDSSFSCMQTWYIWTVSHVKPFLWFHLFNLLGNHLHFLSMKILSLRRVNAGERKRGKLHNEIKGQSVCVTQFDEQ